MAEKQLTQDSGSPSDAPDAQKIESVPGLRHHGKRELNEHDNREHTGFAFPTWKKWTILSVIFAVQLSMNFNTSVYPNVVMPLTKAFTVSGQAARVGQMTFLVFYAFGSELWAVGHFSVL